jgi:hypothetical protein
MPKTFERKSTSKTFQTKFDKKLYIDPIDYEPNVGGTDINKVLTYSMSGKDNLAINPMLMLSTTHRDMPPSPHKDIQAYLRATIALRSSNFEDHPDPFYATEINDSIVSEMMSQLGRNATLASKNLFSCPK